MHFRAPGPIQSRPASSLTPGLAVVAVAVALSVVVHHWLPAVSTLMIALVLGALMTNVGLARPSFAPGFRFAAKQLLRLGIVLVGLHLAVSQVLALGSPVLLMVLLTVAVTFFGTCWLGRRLGMSLERSLLVATGFSICGASAVAAMNGVAKGEEEDVMTAVALVTIFGSVALVVLPLVQAPLGLEARAFGLWAGASVHEVAQVVAAAGAVGSAAVAPAVVVKLTRVVLLAPLVAGVALWMRREARRTGSQLIRPPLVPLFVVGFLVAMTVRSLELLPTPLLEAAGVAQTLLLSAGMFGMGAAVRLRALLSTGGRSLLLGVASTLLVVTVALLGVLAVS